MIHLLYLIVGGVVSKHIKKISYSLLSSILKYITLTCDFIRHDYCKKCCTFYEKKGVCSETGYNVACCTDKKKRKFFLMCKEIQMGSGAKSYMRKGFLKYEEMRK
jgi:hypothetical protein